MRSQPQMVKHFHPLLKKGKVYRKCVTSFIRKARQGEHIVTSLNGVTETEVVVTDDNSWVVCARSAGEYYVLSDSRFRESYDESSGKVIDPDSSFPLANKLRSEGFLEYRPKRRVWAREVTRTDMNFLQNAKTDQADATEVAHFMAPWGEVMRVELGDYLATAYPEEKDAEVYRIERGAFESTYIECKKKSQPLHGPAQALLLVGGVGAILAVLAYHFLIPMSNLDFGETDELIHSKLASSS
jgi:hypothetical protein